jgi:hypothetical protein
MRILSVFARLGVLISAGFLLFPSACNAPKQPSVEDRTHREDLSEVRMTTLRGTRDGAILDVEAMFSGHSMLLTVRMRFAIGVPTTLMSGTWLRVRSQNDADTGTISARSVSFLGGQGGWPSIGGRFDLLDAAGTPRYRVVLPLLELKEHLDAPRTRP